MTEYLEVKHFFIFACEKKHEREANYIPCTLMHLRTVCGIIWCERSEQKNCG